MKSRGTKGICCVDVDIGSREENLNKLRIADVPISRIFDATDLEEGPAFNQQGYALYKKDARTGIRYLRLFVYGNLQELSQHYELLPEEADPTRDFNTLGSVLAHVRCNFLEDDTVSNLSFPLEVLG